MTTRRCPLVLALITHYYTHYQRTWSFRILWCLSLRFCVSLSLALSHSDRIRRGSLSEVVSLSLPLTLSFRCRHVVTHYLHTLLEDQCSPRVSEFSVSAVLQGRWPSLGPPEQNSHSRSTQYLRVRLGIIRLFLVYFY